MRKNKFLVILINFLVLSEVLSKPLNGDNDQENSSNANTSDEQDQIMQILTTPPTPKIIDVNNIDAQMQKYLLENNLNAEQLKQMQEKCRQQNCRNPSNANPINPIPIDQQDSASSVNQFERNQQSKQTKKQFEETALSLIKETIELSLIRNGSQTHAGPKHEIAFSPSCNRPSSINDSFWSEGNTWNLYFQPNEKNMFVSSAVLRLYKIVPPSDMRASEESDCTNQTEQLLRITVSAYARKNRKEEKERRKRMCSSTTVSRSFEGWIEMDVKLAIKMWEKPKRNFGLAVDVQDLDDVQLKASDYFHSYDCNQAAIPWNFYVEQFSSSSYSLDRVPRSPRLDITWIDIQPIYRPYPYFSSNARYSRQSDHQLQSLKNKSVESTSSESDEHDENASKRPNPHRHHHQNSSHNKRHLKKTNDYLHREHNKDLSRELSSKKRYSSENFRLDEENT